jgi:KDO2-lipid IV(A) lauroyltransferase
MIRLALLFMWLIHRLPAPLLRAMGAVLGLVLYLTAITRRRIARTNIRACFPDLATAEQERLVRAAFIHFSQSVLDRAVFWYGSAQQIRRFVKLEGAQHLDALAGQPVILLTPHFVGMEAPGMALSLDRHMLTLYAKQKNVRLETTILNGRLRFNHGVVLARQDGILKAVREMRKGTPFYFLPDMDLGRRDAVFAPFFGIPTATVTTVSRLARLTGAKVLPCIARMTPEGYTGIIFPPWEDYPGASVEADTARMNAFIETQVRALPAQYHWTHKRFKTRPDGDPAFYQD